MSNEKNTGPALTGAAIGLVVLALVVVFAVLIPKAHGESAATLPDKLPGGYVSADLKEAWKHPPAGVTPAQVDQVIAQVKAEIKYGNATLGTTAPEPSVYKIYLKGPSSLFFVQVFKSAGGAFSPGEIADGTGAPQGSSVDQLVKVGKSVCMVSGTADGSGSIQPTQIQCQRSDGDETIQVTTPSGTAKSVAAFADVVAANIG